MNLDTSRAVFLEEPASDASRRDTTLAAVRYVLQLPLVAQPGARGWVHRAMRLRVVESRPDRDVAAWVVKRLHYLGRWPVPPRTLVLSYLAELDGVIADAAAGAAGLVMVALLPGQYHVARALDVHPCSVLSLVRCWRADDLVPGLAPDFTPEMLRRVVRGERSRGPLRGLAAEWAARKCREGGLRAPARLLVTYADPAMGHDGALYLAAGATACGPGAGGKLLFAWALDETLRAPLLALGRAVKERNAS